MPSNRTRRFPTALYGGEHQDPDDVRVGETHAVATEGFERGPHADQPRSDDDAAEAPQADEELADEQRDELDRRRDAEHPAASSPPGNSAQRERESAPRDKPHARRDDDDRPPRESGSDVDR